jgi:K+-sensing histidine kinase KdpD
MDGPLHFYGKQKTKFLGYILVVLVVSIAFVGTVNAVLCYLVMMLLYAFFIVKSTEDQQPLTNVFWVEGIPFIGWLILYLQH